MNPTLTGSKTSSNESSNRKRRSRGADRSESEDTSLSQADEEQSETKESAPSNRKSARLSNMISNNSNTSSNTNTINQKTRNVLTSNRLTSNKTKSKSNDEPTENNLDELSIEPSSLGQISKLEAQKLNDSINSINKKLDEHSEIIQKLNDSMNKIYSKLESILNSNSKNDVSMPDASVTIDHLSTVVIDSIDQNDTKAKQYNILNKRHGTRSISPPNTKRENQEKDKIQPQRLVASVAVAAASSPSASTNRINEDADSNEKNDKINVSTSSTQIQKSLNSEENKIDQQHNDSTNAAISSEKNTLIPLRLSTDTETNHIVLTQKDNPEPFNVVATSSVPVAPITTTIKLTDPTVSEIIEDLGIKSFKSLDNNSPKLTDPLNHEYSSDSSKSEDEDDDLNDSGSGGKKFKTSNGSHKAILNKTKIDTDFIASLIPNKDPNDRRYDPNEINKLRLLSHSYQNFAVKLLVRLFEEDEIIGRNVYGRNYSGDKSVTKQPLDPERINFIKETVLRLTKTNNPELAWASCVIAMNRKMVDINNKYLKSKNKSD